LARVQSVTPTAATTLFLAYSTLNGVRLSVILLAYTDAFHRDDVRRERRNVLGARRVRVDDETQSGRPLFCVMGLVGLVLASILGMLWHNDGL
jgi:FtsH-binding integral membrane protein